MTLEAGVVVIGRNEGARLRSSLESVLATGRPLVYVDSGSSDGSLELAADLGVATHVLDPALPFSAARGRNEGFVRLLEEHPDLEAVLFLDGDCTIDDRVLPAGTAALASDDRLALVCSPVRETDRDRDVWKLLCDLEWDQPAGPIDHCGGIFLIRVEAFRDIRGMDAGIVAGEEPEMCLMLKRRGWRLLRIEEGLVLHDVGAFDFKGWWTRARRSGLAFLLGFLRDGFTRDRQNLREVLRPWFWGVLLPLLALGAGLTVHPAVGLVVLSLYPLHLLRMVLRLRREGRPPRDAWVYALFNLLGRWAEVVGQMRLLLSVLTGTAPSPHALRDSPVFRATAADEVSDPSGTRVGVVVIGRNEGERLKACLRSVFAASDAVVYVDSGSTDGSVEYAEGLGARVVDLDLSIPFTAARARNAGFRELQATGRSFEFVQFVDGDCEVDPDWWTHASRTLDEHPEAAAVCGRRREVHPQHSIYNRLADFEWDTPLGPVKWCGGDVLLRTAAFDAIGGYDPALIACEEPEMCFRLRSEGWIILRIGAEMTRHDADIRRFSQWWTRSTRTGYSYLQASSLHRGEPGRFLHSEIRSALIWGILFPLALVLAIFFPWLFLLLAALLVVQALRIVRRRGRRADSDQAITPAFAFFSILINLPIATGMLRFLRYRLLRRESVLIEYK